jgi:hypothetical protein
MICVAVLAPLLLARTNQNSLIYGTVESVGVAGAIAGGLLMSAWGGLKRRAQAVLGGWGFYGIFGIMLIGLKFGLPVWLAGLVLGNLASVFIDVHNDSIWQAKVAHDLQGRVYSARTLIAWITNPIAPILGGTLADYVLEPAMQAHGWLPNSFAWLVGSGPGSGMGLLIVSCGVMIGLTALVGYSIPAIRNVEDLLKDYGQVQAPANEVVLTEDKTLGEIAEKG